MSDSKKATSTIWCANDVRYSLELERLREEGGEVIKKGNDHTVVELEDSIITVILDEDDVQADIGYTGR